MAWFDIGTALRRDRSAAEDDRDESFGAPPGEVEPGVRVAQAILTPLRKEVARVDGPDCDRPLLRILGEIQHDMESGLSDHIAHRVEVDLASAMPTWFSGRRQAENERVNQMTELLGALGDSLFKMQNRNTKSADRIRDGLGHLQANGTHTTQAQMKRIVNSVLKALDEIDAEGELRIAKMSEKIRPSASSPWSSRTAYGTTRRSSGSSSATSRRSPGSVRWRPRPWRPRSTASRASTTAPRSTISWAGS